MKIFKEYNQSQVFLLPPSLGEFVPENHEARIINDVVDAIDLPPPYNVYMMKKAINDFGWYG